MLRLVHENNVLVDWLAATLARYPYTPQNKATFWVTCIYGHLYKLLVEAQKLKLGLFEDGKTEDPKLRKIFDEFLAPKLVVETKEFSKEKNNMSEILEMEDEGERREHPAGESDEPTRKFTDTHFPTDFKVTLSEDVMKNLEDLGDGAMGVEERRGGEEDMVRIDREEGKLEGRERGDRGEKAGGSDLADWMEIMAYSNRQIEAFVGKKDGEGSGEERDEKREGNSN